MVISFRIILGLTGCQEFTDPRLLLILRGRGRSTNTQGTKPSWRNHISSTRSYTGKPSMDSTGSTPMIRVDIIFLESHIFALNLIVVLYEVIKALIYVKHLKPNINTSFVIPFSLNGCF